MPDRKPNKRPTSRGMRRRAPAPGTRSPILATSSSAVTKRSSVGRPVEAASFQLPKVAPIPAGWRVIGGREFTEYLLSIRFLVLIVLVGLVGAFWVYTLSSNIRSVAGSLSSQLTYYTGEPFPLFLFLFSAPPDTGSSNTALTSVGSFASIVTQFLGPLLGLAFGFDAISNERSEGTLPRLVSQPIHRDDVINGKFAASLAIVSLILGAVMVILAGVGIYRLGIVPNGDVALRLFMWWVFLVLYVAFWIALATLASVVFRRAATALLAVLAVWLVVTFFGGQIAGIIANTLSPSGDSAASQVSNVNLQLSLLRLFPSGQFQEMTAVMLNPSLNTLNASITDPTGRAIPTLLPVTQSLLLVWPQVVAMLGLTAGCFALAYVIFMRQEVRA